METGFHANILAWSFFVAEKLYPHLIALGWLPNICCKLVIEVEGCKCRRPNLTYTTQFGLRPVRVAAVAIHSTLQRKIWKVHGPRNAETCSSGSTTPRCQSNIPIRYSISFLFGGAWYFEWDALQGARRNFKVRGATSRQHPQCFCISRGSLLSCHIFLVDCHDDAHGTCECEGRIDQARTKKICALMWQHRVGAKRPPKNVQHFVLTPIGSVWKVCCGALSLTWWGNACFLVRLFGPGIVEQPQRRGRQEFLRFEGVQTCNRCGRKGCSGKSYLCAVPMRHWPEALKVAVSWKQKLKKTTTQKNLLMILVKPECLVSRWFGLAVCRPSSWTKYAALWWFDRYISALWQANFLYTISATTNDARVSVDIFRILCVFALRLRQVRTEVCSFTLTVFFGANRCCFYPNVSAATWKIATFSTKAPPWSRISWSVSCEIFGIASSCLVFATTF